MDLLATRLENYWLINRRWPVSLTSLRIYHHNIIIIILSGINCAGKNLKSEEKSLFDVNSQSEWRNHYNVRAVSLHIVCNVRQLFFWLALKHTLKLFDTGSSVFVKVEFHIRISLRLLGAVSKNAEKPFFVVVFWCLLVIAVVFLWILTPVWRRVICR